MSAKKRGLGKGLDALLTSNKAPASTADNDIVITADSNLKYLPIEQLKPGKYQPRKDMSEDSLDELANSIKAQGIIQPIVVRQVDAFEYEIIAGERRWRASQRASLTEVPCIIKDVPDEAAVAIALIENIQREDLNAMEEAIALKRLMDEFQLTHQQTADAVGKSRAAVSNLLRLNQLNSEVKTMLEHGDLDMGHARALLALEGDAQTEVAKAVVAKELTVRETEAFVKDTLDPKPQKEKKQKDPDVISLESRLSEQFGAKISIDYNEKGKGKLVINYTSLNELDGIIAKFSD